VDLLELAAANYFFNISARVMPFLRCCIVSREAYALWEPPAAEPVALARKSRVKGSTEFVVVDGFAKLKF
jgi:hypothetical protein